MTMTRVSTSHRFRSARPVRRMLPVLFALVPLALSSLHAQIVRDPAVGGDPIKRLTNISPDVFPYLPQWRIVEPSIKVQVAVSLGGGVKASDSILVMADLPTEGQQQNLQILQVKRGDAPIRTVTGKTEILDILGEKIYQDILSRSYDLALYPTEVPVREAQTERTYNVMEPIVADQFIAASLYRQLVKLSSVGNGRTGRPIYLEQLIGNDEIGYHFWSSGQGKVMIHYPIIPLNDPQAIANGLPDPLTVKLGIAYRVKFGQMEGDIKPTLPFSPRLLNGSNGVKATGRIEYRFPFFGNSSNTEFGATLNFELPAGRGTDSLTHSRDVSESGFATIQGERFIDSLKTRPGRPPVAGDTLFVTTNGMYSLRNVAQGGFFGGVWLDNYQHLFRLTLGVSYTDVLQYRENDKALRVLDAEADPKATVAYTPYQLYHPQEWYDWVYAKLEYLNQSGYPFGLSAQLANSTMLVSGFLPVFPNWLFLEAKFSTPVFRDRRPWEQQPFVTISPVIRISLGHDD